ncbi:hypothetical protein [Leptotrichia sp. oral taxon 223]|uniref:hypothetical protein n=1 Tax=Leptotrichia sp. oral taxon 223 TaxID=712363 RepID=UPI0015BBBE55|nr:hypothetical protein [Leptotrichia sp. oral taxon 223]NWO18314.1 hypothetical protein [Leptotrichia sp. oral taxon 223]
MKNLIIFICVLLSFNIFAERYEGGYVDGKWFPFYRNNLSERICLEPDDGGDERIGCSGGLHGYISFEGGNITITGIAEINDTILFKVSDFNIIDDEGYSYNPSNYPAEKKDKDGKYFPIFKSDKKTITEILKKKNLNFKYNGKDWEEEYFINNYSVIPVSEFKKNEYDNESFTKKKIKFLGVEKTKLDTGNIVNSFYSTDNNFDLETDY